MQRPAAIFTLLSALMLVGGLLLFRPYNRLAPAAPTLPGPAGPLAWRTLPGTRAALAGRATPSAGSKIVRPAASTRLPAGLASHTSTATPYRAAANTRTSHPSLTAPPPPAALPESAQVQGMWGYSQLLPLSCEARAAADWARHFGADIREMEFIARLPTSENPEEGFVGSPYGSWGQIPPGAYGVHAEPVAKVLRSYGVSARAARNLTLNDLRAELAAGRPVLVWVVGHVEPGKGVPYEIDGKTILVARFEHTVILTGYSPQEVTVLDGKKVYQRPVETFLKSWGALGNMAILWEKSGSSPAGPGCRPETGC